MTKASLVDSVMKKDTRGIFHTKYGAECAVQMVLDSMHEGIVEDGKLQLVGFGTFSVEERKERRGKNPQTGEEITIPASNAVKFKASSRLKADVNE